MANADTIFIESLKKDIEKITGDVSDLMWDRKMYGEFCEIIKNNTAIDKENAFYDFVKSGYISHLVLGIGRQTDEGKKTLSLRHLLERINSNPEKVTKKWFAAQYKTLGEGWGEADFEKKFGTLDFVDPTIVQADIESLVSCTEEIRKYRDKRIAHRDKGKIVFDLSFKALDKAIETIEALGIKYYLLLHQAGIDGLLPTDTRDDYREIFYEPWMKH
jgi:hypothetical protein